MIKRIENDQDNLAIPKAKQISPEDLRPLPTAAGKEWDSAVVFYQCKAAAESTRGVGSHGLSGGVGCHERLEPPSWFHKFVSQRI